MHNPPSHLSSSLVGGAAMLLFSIVNGEPVMRRGKGALAQYATLDYMRCGNRVFMFNHKGIW